MTELQEVRFRYFSLDTVMRQLVGHLDSAKIAQFLGLDSEKKTNISMSLSRLVASQPFVAVYEDLLKTPAGLVVAHVVLGQSSPVAHPKHKDTKVHAYTDKDNTLPTSCMLRTIWRPESIQVHMATLCVEAVQDEVRVSKNIHFHPEFLKSEK